MRGVTELLRRLQKNQKNPRPAPRHNIRVLGAPVADVAVKTGGHAAAFDEFSPSPAYHPAKGAAPDTAPIPVISDLPGHAAAAGMPDLASVCVQAASTDPRDLARALGGLREVDFTAVELARQQEGATHVSVRAARIRRADAPVPEAGPAPSRAERFIADMRFRGGLPLFRQVAHKTGWCGLDTDHAWQEWVRWSTEGWAERERELLDAAYREARAQVLGEMNITRARNSGELHMIAGDR